MRFALTAVLFSAGLIVLVSPFASRAYPHAWLLDLLSHLQYPALAFVLYVALRARARIVLCTVALGVALASLGVASSRTGATSATGELRVTSLNISEHAKSESMRALYQVLQTAPPDVLVLIEGDSHARALVERWPQFPHHYSPDKDDVMGVTVVSRHPLHVLPAPRYANEPAVARVLVHAPGGAFALSAVHPLPPLTAQMFRDRNALLVGEARWLVEQAEPGLLAGDFNATPWSGVAKALQEAGLYRLTSLVPTWGAAPGNPLAFLPIDQILGTRHWRVHENAVGSAFGSDHRMVSVSFARATTGTVLAGSE